MSQFGFVWCFSHGQTGVWVLGRKTTEVKYLPHHISVTLDHLPGQGSVCQISALWSLPTPLRYSALWKQGFPGGASVKESACQCRRHKKYGWSLHQEDPLEEGMATHSGILAWRIPWTEEPGGLQSMGLQRVRHDWRYLARTNALSALHMQGGWVEGLSSTSWWGSLYINYLDHSYNGV